jgi:hypothetical protein
MSQETGQNGGFKKDPGINPSDDAVHRDPMVFPLDVHSPGKSSQGRQTRNVPPIRPQPAPTPKPRPQPQRPFQPPPPPRPTIFNPAPAPARKGKGFGCFSWIVSIFIFAALGGYLEPFVRNVISLFENIRVQPGPEAEFEEFKKRNWVANVQLNPRSDPSGYRSVVMTGITGEERRNFFIEKDVRYRVTDAQGARRERTASERMYLKLDDRRYEGFLKGDRDSAVTVSDWGTNTLLRVRVSDISFYREAEVTYIDNDIASFQQRVPRTVFVPKVVVERLMKDESIDGIDARFLNETAGVPETKPGKPTVTQPAEESENVARFPGGRKAWDEFIDIELRRFLPRLQREGRSGTVHLKFLVDEQGFVSEVKALPCKQVGTADCLGPETYAATMLVEAVQRSPRWIPARKDGRTVSFEKTEQVEVRLR